MRSNMRLTRGDLRRRKWLFMPLVRMICPVPVILKRLAAPLWVFILGMEILTPVSITTANMVHLCNPPAQVTEGNYNTIEMQAQARFSDVLRRLPHPRVAERG